MRTVTFVLVFLFYGCSISTVYIKSGYGISNVSDAQDSISHSIFLIGDAGEPIGDGKEKNLSELTLLASIHSEKNTIIFLGDNIYPKGMPDSSDSQRKEMERRIDEQINVGRHSKAHTIFVPGNHDWDKQGREGLSALKRQEDYIISKNLATVEFLPSTGFPGPSTIDIGDDIRIIIVDTQWWLHEYEKPYYPSFLSEEKTKEAFLDSLRELLKTERKTIVVGHHPIETHGEHGGFFDWREHLFPLRHAHDWLWIPLPVIGSLYPLSRTCGISNQDLSGSLYIEMMTKMDSIFSRSNMIAYAAGHEHSLQILEPKSKHYYIVSGYGIESHHESLTTGKNTIFARRAPGFMRMDFLKSGSVWLRVIEASDELLSGKEIFVLKLR